MTNIIQILVLQMSASPWTAVGSTVGSTRERWQFGALN